MELLTTLLVRRTMQRFLRGVVQRNSRLNLDAGQLHAGHRCAGLSDVMKINLAFTADRPAQEKFN